jgi:hypothetical protein
MYREHQSFLDLFQEHQSFLDLLTGDEVFQARSILMTRNLNSNGCSAPPDREIG